MELQILSDPHNSRLQGHYLIIQMLVLEHSTLLIISKMVTLSQPFRQGQHQMSVLSSKFQHLQHFLL